MIISERLSILVEEKSGGNRKAFAEHAGLKQATFNNYIKEGRPPTADALNNICNTYNVNLNWLVAGIGNKYLNDEVEEKTVYSDCFQEVSELQEWLAEISEEDPDRRAWFKMELKDNFPLFKEWLKKRDQANTEVGNQRAA